MRWKEEADQVLNKHEGILYYFALGIHALLYSMHYAGTLFVCRFVKENEREAKKGCKAKNKIELYRSRQEAKATKGKAIEAVSQATFHIILCTQTAKGR